MTLLSVVKDVCAVVGVAVPQSVFSNITGNRTMQEMLALANEMAQRIAYDNRDWTVLRAMATMTGDAVWTGIPASSLPADQVWVGGTTAFSLPANFKRLLLTSNVWRSTSTVQPMHFVPDTEEWMNRRARNASDWAWGEWTILGGQMHIWPAMIGVKPAIPQPPLADIPAVPATYAYFSYLDKNCINLASGGRGDVFMSDTDSFVLDERVLKLGMIWQWKAQKGASYAEDMGTYGDALGYAMGHDSPAPIILGRKPISASAAVAYPWPVPT
jgi:hypothetical protein